MTLLLGGLDLETTGFEAPEGHRIIEVCLLTYDFATREIVDKYVQRIDPDRNIPAAASKVNKIMYEDLVGCPKWDDVAAEVYTRLNACKVVVAHNMNFDGPFVGHELLRVGQPLPGFEPYCTMENGRWACANGKSPNLGELAFSLGVPFNPAKAHGAEYDVVTMMACFFSGLDRGFFNVASLIGAAA